MVGYGLWFGLYPPGDGPVIVAPEVRDAPPAGPALQPRVGRRLCLAGGHQRQPVLGARSAADRLRPQPEHAAQRRPCVAQLFGFLADEGFRTGRADLADYGTRAADSYCFIGNLVG